MDIFTAVVKFTLFALALLYSVVSVVTKDKEDSRYFILVAHLSLILGYVVD